LQHTDERYGDQETGLAYSVLSFQDVNDPRSDRRLAQPVAGIMFTPEWRVMADGLNVGRGEKFQIVVMKPNDVDDRTRVRQGLHHDPDRRSALRITVFREILRCK